MANRLKYNVKFPCGYELSMEISAGFFGGATGHFDEKDFKECPPKK